MFCIAYLREEAPQAIMSLLLRELGKPWQKALDQILEISYVCIFAFARIFDYA